MSTLLLSVAGVVGISCASFPLPLRVRRLPFREPGAPGLLYQPSARSALLARFAAPFLPALRVVVSVLPPCFLLLSLLCLQLPLAASLPAALLHLRLWITSLTSLDDLAYSAVLLH